MIESKTDLIRYIAEDMSFYHQYSKRDRLILWVILSIQGSVSTARNAGVLSDFHHRRRYRLLYHNNDSTYNQKSQLFLSCSLPKTGEKTPENSAFSRTSIYNSICLCYHGFTFYIFTRIPCIFRKFHTDTALAILTNRIYK